MPETTKREHPILFSGPMIRAIRDGRKSQTRRIVKPPPVSDVDSMHFDASAGRWFGWNASTEQTFSEGWRCPFGQPGDVLWVRETHQIESNWNVESEERYPPPFSDGRPIRRDTDSEGDPFWEQCHYRATDPRPELVQEGGIGWRPSIHMPRWACRLTLRVTDVRVERLQEIGLQDVRLEGVDLNRAAFEVENRGVHIKRLYRESHRAFAELWDSINAKRGHPWDSNPWVWAVSFEVIE